MLARVRFYASLTVEVLADCARDLWRHLAKET